MHFRLLNFCNLTLAMVVRDFLKNSEGWMFVSIVNKDYPVLCFEDKSMTALVANKFFGQM